MRSTVRRKRSRRRRSRPIGGRRTLNFAPILAILLVGNLVAAVFLSPLTQMRRVRVVGAPAWDQERVKGRLEALGNTPFLRINGRRIESDLMTSPAVRNASFSGNLFGLGVLKLDYRVPVARLMEADQIGLDDEGVLFRDEDMPPSLMKIQVQPGALTPGVSLAGPFALKHAAELARKLKDRPGMESATITIDRDRGLCFNIERRRVVLGLPEGIDEKLSALEGAMLSPDWQEVAELNLMAPENPTFKPFTGSDRR